MVHVVKRWAIFSYCVILLKINETVKKKRKKNLETTLYRKSCSIFCNMFENQIVALIIFMKSLALFLWSDLFPLSLWVLLFSVEKRWNFFWDLNWSCLRVHVTNITVGNLITRSGASRQRCFSFFISVCGFARSLNVLIISHSLWQLKWMYVQ